MSPEQSTTSTSSTIESVKVPGAGEIPDGCDTPNVPGTKSSTVSSLSWFFSLENRFLAPMLITCILLGGQLTFGMLESWSRTFLAIGASILMELMLGRLMVGKYPYLASAYISGISVGILIRSPFVWPYAMCAALSIMSKYVLRWRDRHLWNPSNFGVSAMLFLYPAAVATLSIQWGNSLWPMAIIWCLGAVIIMRLKRFHICLTYVISFLALSYLRTMITGKPWASTVAPLTGPMYQLFVFFMITDPKTTVRTKWGQCLVAFLVAVVEMTLRLAEVIHAPYYALFLVGPAAVAIEIALSKPCKSVSEVETVPARDICQPTA
ncbi:MAG: RnfABCDGE type electron transport complex subunit D [Planctomycetaceae bacterium]|nr:RnfABCDGE type electron transport complex subunit D [Planctomycetaceae bacterium]MCB9953611.1 RnfABCDGE type electron transport complex subunit D [Planctomycetaceae bacterium]